MPDSNSLDLDWNTLAGYDKIKRVIEDSVMFPLTHQDLFKQIKEHTWDSGDFNRPRWILFEGPPGWGKTTTAKIMSQTVNIPLVYLPLEAVMSKYFGESESKLASIFESWEEFKNWMLFIDEVDSLATSRDNGIHEASRRLLSTLLRKIDSFETLPNVLVILATNRKQDLDSALLSRIELSIKFDLPDVVTRKLILNKYAKQLTTEEIEELSDLTESFSGRSLHDIWKDAERRWGAMYIRSEVDTLIPQLSIYKKWIQEKQEK